MNEVVIHYAGPDEIVRPRFEETFVSIYGMRKSFGFMAIRNDIVIQREFDCWCPECMQVRMAGDDHMNSNYQARNHSPLAS